MGTSSETTPLLQHSNSGRNRVDERSRRRESTEIEQKKKSQDDDTDTGIATMTVSTLAYTVFVQAYLLEGVFPYAGFLTMHLLSSSQEAVNEETVGRYAGYVACSFMVGRTLTAVLWGKLGDAYGRVFVLEVSLVASAITSLGFGFGSTFTQVLFWRFLMGVMNGITGTVKCLLSEIKESSGSEARETQTMALVYGMRGYGFLLCPAITGYLSDPLKQYPQLFTERTPEAIRSFLSAYPFVLPNLLASFLCWSAFRLVRNHVDETLPKNKRRPFSFFFLPTVCGSMCLFRRLLRLEDDDRKGTKLSLPLGNTTHKIETHRSETASHEHASSTVLSASTKSLLWSSNGSHTSRDDLAEERQQIWRRWFHLYVYWMFSFLNIATDELFPLFCLSKLSGLGLRAHQISFVLGGTTLVYLLLQYALLTGLVDKLGLYRTLRVGTFGSVPLAIWIPIGSLWLVSRMNTSDDKAVDEGDADGTEIRTALTPLVVLYLCTLIAIMKSFSSVVFSTVTIGTNRTVDTIDQRATLNGIGSLGGSFAKACGPVFAGTLFSFLAGGSASRGAADDADAFVTNHGIEPPYGSIVSYAILSFLGVLLGVQTLFLRGGKSS